MACQVVITLKNGTVLRGLNYRMDPTSVPRPSVPGSFNQGAYHLETELGWIDIDGDDVASAQITGLRPT